MSKTDQRRYSDDEKAAAPAALAANGGKTARQLSMPRKTLERWDRGGVPNYVAQIGHKKRGLMADALEDIAWQLLDVLPGKIGTASLAQTATSLGIAIDKAQLLRGKPTGINFDVYLRMSREELEHELAELRGKRADLE